MAGEDGELLLEEGGVRGGGDVDADGRLLQPLVAAPILCSEAKSSQQTRLASLDVFRGLSIGVCVPQLGFPVMALQNQKESMALCDV